MSDTLAAPAQTDDALLAQADALHDDEPRRALEMLGRIDPASLPVDRLPRLAFLLNHVVGEKFGQWAQALAAQRRIVARLGENVPPAVLRQAAVAAATADDTRQALAWTQALATGTGAPIATAEALVSLAAAGFAVSRQDAQAAGRLTLHALQPLADVRSAHGSGLDSAFGVVTNNLASDLLERPWADLQHPDLRAALELTTDHAQRFWQRAGTWLNVERAHYLCAMSANALGAGAQAVAQARAGLALLDAHDVERGEDVDRAFLELELAMGLRLTEQPGRAEALARARALAARFGDAALDRWFADRSARNEALAAHYGR